MKELMIATSNAHKVEEFKKMLEPRGIVVKSLLDLEEQFEIEENGTTFEENALIKARSIAKHLDIPVISDDSGLVIDALGGAPGIHSARYLGKDTDYMTKNTIVLSRLADVTGEGRSARFVCAMGLVYPDGKEMTFTGTIEGYIHDKIERLGTVPPKAIVNGMDLIEAGFGNKNLYSEILEEAYNMQLLGDDKETILRSLKNTYEQG